MNPEENQVSENSSGSSAGPIIGTVIILAVIVLGGLYFWGQRGDSTEQALDEMSAQSQSDEVADIQADLDSTDVDVEVVE